MDTRPYVKAKHRGERPNNTVGNIFLSVPYQYQPWNFKHGFALQTLLSIIILCAKVSIVGLQVGLSKATHFKDGRRTASLVDCWMRQFPTTFFRKSRTL